MQRLWFSLCMILGMSSAALSQSRDFFKAQVQIPSGTSVLTIPLTTSGLASFRVLYLPGPSCVQFSASAEGLLEGSKVWTRATSLGQGTFAFSGTLRALRLILQSSYTQQSCLVSLSTLAPDESSKVYLGLLNFEGGFVYRASLPLNAAPRARYLEAIIPQYCSGVEIIDVGSTRAGVYAPAREVSGRPGLFELADETSFDRLEVSVAGPDGQRCQIPFYLYPAAG